MTSMTFLVLTLLLHQIRIFYCSSCVSDSGTREIGPKCKICHSAAYPKTITQIASSETLPHSLFTLEKLRSALNEVFSE